MLPLKQAKIIQVIVYITILLLLFNFCTQCLSDKSLDALDNTDKLVIETNRKNESNNPPDYKYHIFYKDIKFIPSENREVWREPLVKLLSNNYSSSDKNIGYPCLYSDKLCTVNGYQLGLFDFDIDEIPELLVNLGGGSAGNTYFYVYDILTGELLGSLEGDYGESWCTYFNLNTKKYEIVGQFEWRVGTIGKQRLVRKATLENDINNNRKTLYENPWLHAYYKIDTTELKSTQNVNDKGVLSTKDEIYTGVEFSVNGNKAYIDEYFAEYDFLCTIMCEFRKPH